MFCTVCAAQNAAGSPVCAGCGSGLHPLGGTRAGSAAGRARTVAGMLPPLAVLVLLLVLAGRSWREDRARAYSYAAADAAFAVGRPLTARGLFAELDGYRDADDRAGELDDVLVPLAARTQLAGGTLARGETRAAILELREIVAAAPDLQEAVVLLERARRSLVAESIAASERSRSAGDVVAAREALLDGLALEPTSAELTGRLADLDATHPLLLLTDAGDVAVTGFDGERPRMLSTGKDASWAVWSADRTRLAFLGAAGSTEDWRSNLWVVDASGGGERLLADNVFRAGVPTWSPDGRTIVFVTGDDFDWNVGRGWIGLRAVDVATGAQRDLTGRRFDFTTSVVWSPDGRQLAFVERHVYRPENTRQLDVRGGDLFVLDLASLETRNVTRGRIADLFWVSWSPRGDAMLALTDVDSWESADPTRLFRVDVATDRIDELATSAIMTGYPVWSPDGSMAAAVQDDRVVRLWSEGGEAWVRLPTNLDAVLSWAPDGSALVVPPKSVQDATHIVHVGAELGRIDTIRVMFDNSYSSGGPPQWSPRTQPLPDEPLPSGTALD